jgi:flagellar biosynthetic protein FliO
MQTLAAATELAPSGFGVALLKMIAALVVVCFLAYLVLRLVHRYGAGASGREGAIRVAERRPLDGRHDLWVVQVGDRVFLLGTTEGSVTRLAELEPEALPQLESPAGAARPAFAELLARPSAKRHEKRGE